MADNFTWNGKAVAERAKRAQIAGVNRVMAKAVIHAKNNHDWKNRTGVLEGSIGVAEYARDIGSGVRGEWGSKDAKYALIHELGGTIVPVTAQKLAIPQAGGGVAFADSVTIPARPYLRPAADEVYPGLADAIRDEYRKAA